MRCPACQAALGQVNPRGEPMIRTRGLILKADGVVAVCPSCKGDVPLAGEMAKALRARLLVVIPNRQATPAPHRKKKE